MVAMELVGGRPNQAIAKEAPFAPIGNSVAKHAHAVQKIQLTSVRDQIKMQEKMDAVTFGMHFPMEQKLERTMLAQHQRLPGLPNSFVGLNAHMDMDETQEFEDFLNTKESCPIPDYGFHHTVHDLMEKKLGMEDKL